jgi:hypothetical protein
MLDIDTNDSTTKEVIKKALEMERQQIIDAYSTPLSKSFPWMDDWRVLAISENYYTQTFTEPKND